VKRFSSKLMSALLVTLLIVSVIGCKSAPEPVEQVPAAAVVKPVAPAKEEAPVVEKAEAPAEVAEVVEAPVKEEAPKAEVKEEPKEVTVVEEPKMPEVVYPYGVKEIVKATGHDVFDLFIVHTNDVHGRLEATDSNIGYSRLATMMQVARSITDNILLLDAGDAISGSNLVNLYKGETAAVLLDMLGYDAITLGNHEFDYGLDRILEASKIAKEYSNVKVLSANTLDKNGYLLFQPYQVYNFNGFKVGVVGLTTPDTAVTTNPKNIQGVTFDDPMIINNAQAAIDLAHQYVDYVIVLGHFGLDENGPSGYTSKLVLENLDGIDLWIDGHSHDLLPNGEYVNGALLVQAGEYMENVGVVDVLVKNKKVVSQSAFVIKASDVVDPANSPLASAYGITSVPEDPQVKAYIDAKKAELDAVYSNVVASVPSVLQGERADVRTRKTNLSQMICTAMTESSDADFTITNGGGIRASIDAGDVTMGEVITVLPFNNVVTVCELTGAQVYEALEHGYSALPNAAGSYAQTDLKVIYNKYAEPGKRIIRVYANGQAIKKDSTVYHVATNDFMAAGGDGYTMFDKVISMRDLMSDVLANYLAENYPAK
jgi:2',3'-cyclic-nucleotide 2'-phosphodiesterase (5'-nucleotidase family)